MIRVRERLVFAKLRSGESPGAVLQCLPEPRLDGPPVAFEHGLDRLPAVELAEHPQQLIHQVRGVFPPERVPDARAPSGAAVP